MVESVFWPRWQVSTWAQVGSKYLLCPPLNFSECFSGSLLVVCLFVCFSQTNKNCWLQPFRTCHRLAAIVTLVAISALTKLVAWLLLSLVNFITLDQVQGKIFLLELSLGHVHWTFFSICPLGVLTESQEQFSISTDSREPERLACQLIPWINWLGRLSHVSVDLPDWINRSPMGLSWPVSRSACPGGSGGSTVSTSQNILLLLFCSCTCRRRTDGHGPAPAGMYFIA